MPTATVLLRRRGQASRVQGRPTRETGRSSDSAHSGLPIFLKALAAEPVRRPADATNAFAMATAGRPGALPFRQEMESAFGRDFSRVETHLGTPQAQAGLSALEARAAARGNAVAFRDSAPTRHVVAHELAHVAQQSPGRTGPEEDRVLPGADAERRADAAADAVSSNRPVPGVGSVAGSGVQRMPETFGGEWSTPTYAAVNNGAGVGKQVGANIQVNFTPGELVFAETVGLIQTVKTLTNSAAGRPLNQTSFPAGNKRNFALTAGEGDLGRAIDQGDGADPNTNPLYAVEDPVGTDSRTLTDVSADARFGGHGHRRQLADGTVDTEDAWLGDRPSRRITFAGQEWRQTFEVAALVLDGAMSNTFLGSIEWGWRADATGTATVDPSPVTVVGMGTPSANFMAAAQKWNDATLTDSAGGRHATVDVPITTHRTVDPAGLSDAALHRRMRRLADEIMRMNRDSVDYQQKRFEIRAYAREVLSRGRDVADSGHTYTVREGDTLWGISARHLGRGRDWTKIMALNAVSTPNAAMLATLGLGDLIGVGNIIRDAMLLSNALGTLDPNLIYPGQVLRMPTPYRPIAAP